MCNLSTVRCRTISHVNATMIIICNFMYIVKANDWILEFIRFVFCFRYCVGCGVGDCVIYMSFTKTRFLFNLTTIETRDATQIHSIRDECQTYFSRITVHQPSAAKKIKKPKTNRTIRRRCIVVVLTQVQFSQNTHANKLVRAQRLHAAHTNTHAYDEARTHIRPMFVDFIFFPLSSSSPEFADVETSLFVAPQHHTNQYRASIGHAEMSPVCVTDRCVCSSVFER